MYDVIEKIKLYYFFFVKFRILYLFPFCALYIVHWTIIIEWEIQQENNLYPYKTMNWNFATIDHYNNCSSQSWALSKFILLKFKEYI